MPYNDKLGYHELLQAAHIMASTWGDHIESHPVLDSDPVLKAEAERIAIEIAEFYQLVSRRSDEVFPERPRGVAKNADDVFLRLKAILLDPAEDAEAIAALDAVEVELYSLRAENERIRALMERDLPKALAQVVDLVRNHIHREK